jgi:hypothetical protein
MADEAARRASGAFMRSRRQTRERIFGGGWSNPKLRPNPLGLFVCGDYPPATQQAAKRDRGVPQRHVVTPGACRLSSRLVRNLKITFTQCLLKTAICSFKIDPWFLWTNSGTRPDYRFRHRLITHRFLCRSALPERPLPVKNSLRARPCVVDQAGLCLTIIKV